MKITTIAIALTVLAGCAIVPIAPYDVYSPYYPSSYYASTDNEYYSYGYSIPQYSSYYGSPYPGYYGYGYGYYRPWYPGYYGHGYYRPRYPGYYGPRYHGYYGGRGYGYRGGYGHQR